VGGGKEGKSEDDDGGGEHAPWRYIEGFSSEDRELLNVRCNAGTGCTGGSHLAIPPPPPPSTTAALPTGTLFGTPCNVCKAPFSQSTYAHVTSLYAALHSLKSWCVEGLEENSSTKLLLEKGGAALRAACSGLLGPRHHLISSLSFSLMHAAVDSGKFPLALWAGKLGETAFEFSHAAAGAPHPSLFLHFAALGKLHNFMGDSKSAVECFERALAGLSITHGSSHPLVKEFEEELGGARYEMKSRGAALC